MLTQSERERARVNSARYRDRMRSKGYRMVHGRFTDEPPKNRTEADGPPEHGTVARYRSRRWPCKCDECLEAIADYNDIRRKMRLGLL